MPIMDCQRLGNAIFIVTTLAGIVGVYPAMKIFLADSRAQQNGARPQESDVHQKKVAEDGFAILYPVNGAAVSQRQFVRGRMTTGLKQYVYLVVTPLAANGPTLQENMVTVVDGEWQGIAEFGTRSVGRGETFALKAIASNLGPELMQEGELPRDAIVSDVVVTRKKKEYK
jgi:hypothetical protein